MGKPKTNKWTGPGLEFAGPPKNEEELAQAQSAMANSKVHNYPPAMEPCSVVGLNGGCGEECFVLIEDNCPIQDEMKENLTKEKWDEIGLD